MKIAIDLGHGCGQDRGAIGVIAEETIIDTVGKLVISKLKELGHTVIETRPIGHLTVNDSLYQRYTKSDSNNCEWCISIHANASSNNTAHGVEIFTYGGKQLTEAKNILENLVKLGFYDRGIKDGSGLAMVKRPKAKSMLIEICFCTNNDDVALYKNNIENIANGIVFGLTGISIIKKIGWKQDSNGYWYVYSDGTYPKSKWFKVDNDWYYADSEGYCYQNRWLKDNDKWYYFKDNCKMAKGETLVYKFNENGEFIN